MLEMVSERRVVMGAGESSEKCRRWRNMMCTVGQERSVSGPMASAPL